MSNKAPTRFFAKNRKALHDYTVIESLEAGIVLLGSEVKSVRSAQLSLTDSFAIEKMVKYLYRTCT